MLITSHPPHPRNFLALRNANLESTLNPTFFLHLNVPILRPEWLVPSQLVLMVTSNFDLHLLKPLNDAITYLEAFQ